MNLSKEKINLACRISVAELNRNDKHCTEERENRKKNLRMKNDHLHLNAGRMLCDGGGDSCTASANSMNENRKDREKERIKQHNLIFTFVTVVISNSQSFFLFVYFWYEIFRLIAHKFHDIFPSFFLFQIFVLAQQNTTHVRE